MRGLVKWMECKGEHKRASQLLLKLVTSPMHKKWKGLLRNPNLASIGPRWKLRPTKWLKQWLSTIFKTMYENKISWGRESRGKNVIENPSNMVKPLQKIRQVNLFSSNDDLSKNSNKPSWKESKNDSPKKKKKERKSIEWKRFNKEMIVHENIKHIMEVAREMTQAKLKGKNDPTLPKVPLGLGAMADVVKLLQKMILQ